MPRARSSKTSLSRVLCRLRRVWPHNAGCVTDQRAAERHRTAMSASSSKFTIPIGDISAGWVAQAIRHRWWARATACRAGSLGKKTTSAVRPSRIQQSKYRADRRHARFHAYRHYAPPLPRRLTAMPVNVSGPAPPQDKPSLASRGSRGSRIPTSATMPRMRPCDDLAVIF